MPGRTVVGKFAILWDRTELQHLNHLLTVCLHVTGHHFLYRRKGPARVVIGVKSNLLREFTSILRIERNKISQSLKVATFPKLTKSTRFLKTFLTWLSREQICVGLHRCCETEETMKHRAELRGSHPSLPPIEGQLDLKLWVTHVISERQGWSR